MIKFKSVVLFAMMLSVAISLTGCVGIAIAINEKNLNGVDVPLSTKNITALYGPDAQLPKPVKTTDIPKVIAMVQEAADSPENRSVLDTLKLCSDGTKKCYVIAKDSYWTQLMRFD